MEPPTSMYAPLKVVPPSELPLQPIPDDLIHALLPLGFVINERWQIREHGTGLGYVQPFVGGGGDMSMEAKSGRELMYKAVRDSAVAYLTKHCGLRHLYLPQLPQGYEPGDSTPVLIDPVQKPHVVVIVGDREADLGVWSYRSVFTGEGQSEGGSFLHGTMIGLVHYVKSMYPDEIQLVILNVGQNFSNRTDGNSMTKRTYEALPAQHQEKKSGMNRIRYHETAKDHINTVWRKLITDSEVISPSAHISIIGTGEGGQHFVNWLCWPDTKVTIKELMKDNWRDQLGAVAFTSPFAREAGFGDLGLPFDHPIRQWLCATGLHFAKNGARAKVGEVAIGEFSPREIGQSKVTRVARFNGGNVPSECLGASCCLYMLEWVRRIRPWLVEVGLSWFASFRNPQAQSSSQQT